MTVRERLGVIAFEALFWSAIVGIGLVLFGAGPARGADSVPVYDSTTGGGAVTLSYTVEWTEE